MAGFRGRSRPPLQGWPAASCRRAGPRASPPAGLSARSGAKMSKRLMRRVLGDYS